MVGYVGSPHHFRCITVRTGSMLIKFVRTWARLPTLLAFVTHNRVNDGQIYLQLISPFQNSPTNRVSGTMSKAAGMFLAHFPRFMLKRRRRRPNSTKPLLFSPIFRSCTQLYDKAGSLYVNPCQTNKNKKTLLSAAHTSSLWWSRIYATQSRHNYKERFPQSGL